MRSYFDRGRFFQAFGAVHRFVCVTGRAPSSSPTDLPNTQTCQDPLVSSRSGRRKTRWTTTATPMGKRSSRTTTTLISL